MSGDHNLGGASADSISYELSKEEILTANLEDFLVDAGGYINSQQVLDGLGAIGDIANIAEVTKQLVNSTHDVFKPAPWVRGKVLKFQSLASSVINGMRTDFSRINELLPRSELNPYFKIFRDQVESIFPELGYEYKLLCPCSNNEYKDLIASLNGFVNAIRNVSKQEEFIRLTQNQIRSSNKNQLSLNKYLDRLFEYRSRLLVIRVDLQYEREYALQGESPISYEEADNHRKKMVNDLRNILYKDSYVGYVWKLECGAVNSLHYHFIIFLDAAKKCRDVSIARTIGEYWKNIVTEGKGRYWNCNAKKNEYRNCGVGEIPYNDAVLRANLKKAASYLIKADYFIKSAIPSRRRTFGKGSALSKIKTNRGRPRSN